MADIAITYESLYDILRKEKYKPELQKISANFFKHTIDYINTKKSILDNQKTSIFSAELQKTQTQLNNIKRILKEIYERRENKIIQLALFSSRMSDPQDTTNMLPEEKILYALLIENLDKYRKGILLRIIEGSLPLIEEEKPKTIKMDKKEETKLVRFLHSIPKFIGDDLNIYGPFEAEDISNLPEKVADVLVDKKRAEEFK